MNKKTYTAPEAEIEKFNITSSILTAVSDPDPEGGLDEGDNIIDF